MFKDVNENNVNAFSSKFEMNDKEQDTSIIIETRMEIDISGRINDELE